MIMLIRVGMMLLVGGMVCATVLSETETVVLDNGMLSMTINVYGGSVSKCVLNGSDLNPFSWKSSPNPGDRSLKEGMFVCFDRLGRPTEEEQKLGMPAHGEATAVNWKILKQNTAEDGSQVLQMSCHLPLAGMTLVREYCLFKDASVCRITDRVRNDNTFPKPYNIVQHPSLGAPFLDHSVIVDCNAVTGFVNTKNISKLPGPTVSWPEILYQTTPINLRAMKDGKGMVVNYICDDASVYGWGCVSNPDSGLLVGYIWPTADYPWIRIWRHWDGDAPDALGLEFGTTPLAVSLEEIQQVGPLLGHDTIETLDPGAEKVKTFYLFLSKVPSNFSGVANVSFGGGALNIEERAAAKGRRWMLPCTAP